MQVPVLYTLKHFIVLRKKQILVNKIKRSGGQGMHPQQYNIKTDNNQPRSNRKYGPAASQGEKCIFIIDIVITCNFDYVTSLLIDLLLLLIHRRSNLDWLKKIGGNFQPSTTNKNRESLPHPPTHPIKTISARTAL